MNDAFSGAVPERGRDTHHKVIPLAASQQNSYSVRRNTVFVGSLP